ncbi:MAG: hypothetical protein WD749_12690, partial [Phycisphaerales bacterium]
AEPEAAPPQPTLAAAASAPAPAPAPVRVQLSEARPTSPPAPATPERAVVQSLPLASTSTPQPTPPARPSTAADLPPALRVATQVPLPSAEPSRTPAEREATRAEPTLALAPAAAPAPSPAPARVRISETAPATTATSLPTQERPLLESRPLAPAAAPEPDRPALPLSQPQLPAALATDLRLPTAEAPLEAPVPPKEDYAQRAPEVRQQILEERGGDPRTEEAVKRALAWLARHQHSSGRWDGNGFDRGCGDCNGAATVECDAALTALAVLCFLGADHTPAKDGPYREHVTKAIDWLLRRQSESGDFRNGESLYSHAMVTIALAEAAGMTGDPRLTEPLERAVRFIEQARSPEGGWRYEPGQYGDTSVLGWQLMAMVGARRAGVTVSDGALAACTEWLDAVSTRRAGVYSYQPSSAPTASMTAEALFCRQLLGEPRESPRTAASLEFLKAHPPKWTRRSTTYYWYYATLALFQHGGEEWDDWNEAVKKELLENQETEGGQAGSWDPLDRWTQTGGRVYQTAICTLTLEVYYRYLPMYGRPHRAAGKADGPERAPE